MQNTMEYKRAQATKQPASTELTKSQKARFLLNLLGERAKEGTFSDLRSQLHRIVEEAPDEYNQQRVEEAARQLLQFADPRTRSTQPDFRGRSNTTKEDRDEVRSVIVSTGYTHPQLRQPANVNGEHPAIIARRLLPLSLKERQDCLGSLSGEVARQVRFLTWSFEKNNEVPLD